MDSQALADCLSVLEVVEGEFKEERLRETLEDKNTALMAQKRVKLN